MASKPKTGAPAAKPPRPRSTLASRLLGAAALSSIVLFVVAVAVQLMAAEREGVRAKERARAAAIAKARCSDAFNLIGDEAVQMHGGIGMTDEHDIGFFLKRARAAEITFGDAAFHRERFAALQGY